MKMLCIALLALSGLTVNAEPTCSDFEIENVCKKFQSREPQKPGFPKSEEDIDAVCNATLPMIDCLIKESENCPDTLNGRLLDQYRDQKELYDDLCNKGSEFHNKYLENVKCLERILDDSSKKCTIIIGSDGHECEDFFSHTGCIYLQVYEKCGNDAPEVIKALGKESRRMMKKKCFKDE